jgi:hypothetical protein
VVCFSVVNISSYTNYAYCAMAGPAFYNAGVRGGV